MSKIIVITEVPRFSDARTHMRCELVSDDEKWVFFIPWDYTQLAIPACVDAVDSHMRRIATVARLPRPDPAHS